MTEFDLRSVSPESGYPRENVVLWLDLYRLLSVVGASKYLTKFRSQDEFSHYDMHSIFRDFEYSELSRLLVSVAGQLRNHIDNDYFYKNKDKKVGSMNCEGTQKKLTLRDACNKILHAENINFDLCGKPENIYESHLKSKVYLYGVKNNSVEWKVTIFLDIFVEEAFNTF